MKINYNIPAMRTINSLYYANKNAATAMQRLSSGLKINKAKDDTAGHAIGNKMDAQIKGLSQASRNAMDGLSLIETAEGAYNEVHAIIQRMRELAVTVANETYGETDRQKAQEEISLLSEEINAIKGNTEFNKKNLLDGPTSVYKVQIGANQGQLLEIPPEVFDLTNIASITDNVDITTSANAAVSILALDSAIEEASVSRSRLGAYQNRLEFTIKGLAVNETTITAAMSRIMDADMALEMSEYTKNNILSQSATAMLAQANQRPEMVLRILQQ